MWVCLGIKEGNKMNYWKTLFNIQLIVIVILFMVGLPTNETSMYIWLGVIFVDMVVTHPVWYKK